jgi:hypothetical protein
MPRVDRLLFGVGVAHALVAVICVPLVLAVDAAPILGVHPALKPFKFALSIAVFLGAMAVLVPALSISEATRRTLAGALSLTMVVEMTIIATQALRGQRSHFNLERPFDVALTSVMMLGIVVLLASMIATTLLASLRPLAQSPLVTAAWRAALWIFLLSAASGIAMGARAGHTVGGADGGPGLPVTNWSTTHGDLRVSHFFALHALQIIPLFAVFLSWLPIRAGAQWILLALGIGANVVVVGWTWLQALGARSLW